MDSPKVKIPEADMKSFCYFTNIMQYMPFKELTEIPKYSIL